MKKRLLFTLALSLIFVILMTACSPESESNDSSNSVSESESASESESVPPLQQITGITFTNKTYTYDGTEKTISISGTLPSGVNVSYVNNKGTNAGVYTAKATLSGDGYETLQLTATLTVEKATITGITFASNTYTYNGSEHSLLIAGTLPAGVSPTYENNVATNAGVYNAKATLSGSNYKTLVLDATLTVSKADITGITFTGETFEYDALPHSIYVLGNVPAGVSAVYTCNGVNFESATEVGEYPITATLSGQNHNTLTLNATLKIKATEEMLYSILYNGCVYFQNALDSNKLYMHNGTTLSKVNNDVAQNFTTDGTALYYSSNALFGSSIKEFTSAASAATLYPNVKASAMASDGTYLYYAVSSLLGGEKNGIYRLALDGDDTAEPTKIVGDKTSFLAIVDNNIYYANGSDGNKLYVISKNAENGTGIALSENKVSDIIESNGSLYFTEHTLTNSKIFRYIANSGEKTQLTIDNGAYLTKVGNYIYYVNKDLLTSTIFGKGIYRVSILGGSSEKLLEVTDGNAYYSLTSDGTNLYYYKLNDKHLYSYNIATEVETDLMANFVPVEDTTMLGYSFLAEHNGEIYYTSLTDAGCLYKYNPQTRAKYKVLPDSVSNVYFNGGYMYYSTYILTNYALWRMDLSTNESVKISSGRYEQLIFDNETIYAIRIGASGTHTNKLVKMDLDGQNETELYTDKNCHFTSLSLIDGKLYFCINPAIGYKYIYTYDIENATDTEDADNTNKKSDKFVSLGNTVYYYDHTSDKLCALSNGSSSVLVSDVKINEIYLIGTTVYYSTATTFESYDTVSGQRKTITDSAVTGVTEVNGTLYYVKVSITYALDYPILCTGDGCVYSYNTATETETKLHRS